jgi:hypothetical protein
MYIFINYLLPNDFEYFTDRAAYRNICVRLSRGFVKTWKARWEWYEKSSC